MSGSIHSVCCGVSEMILESLVWAVRGRFALRVRGWRASSLWRWMAADWMWKSRAVSIRGREASQYIAASGVIL